MTKTPIYKIPLLYFVLFVLSVSPFFAKLIHKQHAPDIKSHAELYDPKLIRLNTIHKLENYVDSVYRSKKGQGEITDTAFYVSKVSELIKYRFIHGLSNYSFSENWIAYLSGKLMWSHLSAIVDPEDILKHPEGLCSQQTIVFMEVLKRKGINVRSVGLGYKEGPGHFLCEVNYKGGWHLYDVTLEPQWSRIVNHHKSMDYYLSNKDSLYVAYEKRLPKPMYTKLTEKVAYGDVNAFPAKKMQVFHQATLIATYLLPVVFFALFLLLQLGSSGKKANVSHISVPVSEIPGEVDLINI